MDPEIPVQRAYSTNFLTVFYSKTLGLNFKTIFTRRARQSDERQLVLFAVPPEFLPMIRVAGRALATELSGIEKTPGGVYNR